MKFTLLVPILILFTALTWAQDEVHIVPRTEISVPVLRGKEDTIRVRVNLALVPVVVQEKFTGHPYPFLQQGHFKLFFDKKEQPIRYFSTEDAPVSIGLVFDRSGSMGWKVDQAKTLIQEFSEQLNRDDEIFVITFADTITETSFTSVQQDVTSQMLFVQSKGATSLLDAIYVGVDKMRSAKYQRRALIIVTDGGDNHSRYTEKEVKSMVEESDSQIFAIALLDPDCARPGAMITTSCPSEILHGPELLGTLVEAAGGTGYILSDNRDIKKAVTNIGLILRQEYLLGFTPNVADGKYHKIKVQLQRLPRGTPELTVVPKGGVYAPVD